MGFLIRLGFAQPLEDGGFNGPELGRARGAELADGPDGRVGRNTLRDERPVLEERRLDLDLKLRAAQRRAVKNDRDPAWSVSAKGMLKTITGRTFSAMPQSNIQTSPRLGVMFFAFEYGSQVVAGACQHLVLQRAGVNWRQPPEELSYEHLFFCRRQRIKRHQQSRGFSTHTFILS